MIFPSGGQFAVMEKQECAANPKNFAAAFGVESLAAQEDASQFYTQ